MKIFHKINCWFLEDEITGEKAPIADHIVFYSVLGFMVVMGAIFTYNVITF